MSVDGHLTDIATHVHEVLGERDVRVERIAFGGVNYVYRVATRDRRVIVRIPRVIEGRKELLLNRWCAAICRQCGVPAALVIDIRQSYAGEPVAVEEFIEGTNACEAYQRTDPPPNTLSQFGAILERLHSIPIVGFGRLDEIGQGVHRTWADFLLAPLPLATSCSVQLVLAKFISTEEFTLARRVLEHAAHMDTTATASMLHGDLDTMNIMVLNDNVTGLVDWGDALGGPPLYDVIRFELVRGSTLAQALLSHSPHLNYAAFKSPVANAYRVRLGLDAACWRMLARDETRALKALHWALAAAREYMTCLTRQ